MVDFAYEGLGMADWRDIVNAYAKPEPCRPFTVRVLSHGQILVRVALELGVRVNGSRYLTDFEGLRLSGYAWIREKTGDVRQPFSVCGMDRRNDRRSA